MPAEPLALEVLMEKSAFVARQKSTQELERLRDSPHGATQAPEFEDPLKTCLDTLSKPLGRHRGVLRLVGQRWRGG